VLVVTLATEAVKELITASIIFQCRHSVVVITLRALGTHPSGEVEAEESAIFLPGFLGHRHSALQLTNVVGVRKSGSRIGLKHTAVWSFFLSYRKHKDQTIKELTKQVKQSI
jgi:hypothetical protein